MRRILATAVGATLLLAACTEVSEGGDDPMTAATATQGETLAAVTDDFEVAERGTFDEGWALEFLPGTEKLLVTERGGALQLRDQRSGEVTEVSGVPEVEHSGQGGLHDVVAGPTFADDGTVYLSWVRAGDGGARGVVGRATLEAGAAELRGLEEIWEQEPAPGGGHFALRLLVDDEHLYVTSGDRQQLTPAQDPGSRLGKVLRLTPDGEPAPGNPWADDGGVASELWTVGHRNPLGIARDTDGRIWVSEMGPEGGDELNLLEAGENYGWPEASQGVHYSGEEIPDHAPGDGFRAPAASWVPAISPANLHVYSGELFAGWAGSALLGGLSGRTLQRVELDGERAEVAQRWAMGERIRAVAEAPDGAIWILEDGSGGRLLELTPA